ncbi:hypothetical protein [Pseudoramibacter faecis]|uniref:hypothetical protein n=1 Tax=Pseudoramibacter faecis TaxID=3108534 RepID=UPI002E789E52|nr:hypothetical protein [Pseudoramibacter sp. HA2172]
MNMDESFFMDWYYTQASEAERKLFDKMDEFSDLFEDMLFEPGTASYELIKCQSKSADSDEWRDDEAPRPESLEYFSYTFFKTKIESLDGREGYYDHQNQIICLSPEVAEDDATLLHEMIHLHESVINELPLYFHDMLYWALYHDLREKITELDQAITQHAHILNESTIYNNGGLHDILFLLKSFDLDIRKGYPLGTVFAYGGVDDFKFLTYKK